MVMTHAQTFMGEQEDGCWPFILEDVVLNMLTQAIVKLEES
jgi:hypothetical protein